MVDANGQVISNVLNIIADKSGGDLSYKVTYTLSSQSKFIGVDSMMFIFSNMYANLCRMVKIYCWDEVNEDFDKITDELEFIFHRYIEYEESVWNNIQ